MSTKGIVDYHISNHAKQRFAERIMGRDNTYDVNKFILEHEAKIQTDICKMIEYGDLIFTGKQSQKDGKGKVVDVYLSDCWVVLVDSKSTNVITLFKVDLGVDDDFNRQYIEKMMEKLNRNKEELDGVQAQVLEENEEYRGFIEEAETQSCNFFNITENASYKSWLLNSTTDSSYWCTDYISRADSCKLPSEMREKYGDNVVDELFGDDNDDTLSEEDNGPAFDRNSVIPVKISVSDIKRIHAAGDDEEDIVDLFVKKQGVTLKKINRDKSKKRSFTPAEKGTLTHTCLQLFDFGKCREIHDIDGAEKYVAEFL